MQRSLHNIVLRVHQLEILAHVPEIAGNQGFQLQTQVGQGALKFFVVLGFHFLFFRLFQNSVDDALWQFEVITEALEGGILLL